MKFPFRRAPRDIPCIEFVELVTDYLEGVLPGAPSAARFEHHLRRLRHCASYLEQMRETRRLTGALRRRRRARGGHEELMAAFRAYQAERADE